VTRTLLSASAFAGAICLHHNEGGLEDALLVRYKKHAAGVEPTPAALSTQLSAINYQQPLTGAAAALDEALVLG